MDAGVIAGLLATLLLPSELEPGTEVRRPRPPVVVPANEEPLVDLAGLHPAFRFDLRYATEDNFAGQRLYSVARCALRKKVADRMIAAQRWLDAHHPGHRLLFKDCYRPNRIQERLWAAVKDTKKRGYVADPGTPIGSIHSYGAAVDLTLADTAGRELDMGSPYDFLGRLAEPKREEELLAAGKLTQAQVERRRLLRTSMIKAGMAPIRSEWWHFNAPTRRRYSRLDVPLEAIP